MAEAQPYELEHREVVAEAPNLRVSIRTLAAGQCVPWHYHSEIIDTFFCIEGPMVVRRVMVKCCVLRFSGGDFINLDSVLEFHTFEYIGQPV